MKGILWVQTLKETKTWTELFCVKTCESLLDNQHLVLCQILNPNSDITHIKVLNGNRVWYWGFDIEDNVRKHITSDHTDILMQISKDINEEKEDTSSQDESASQSEDDEAFLARFDDDGNLIG